MKSGIYLYFLLLPIRYLTGIHVAELDYTNVFLQNKPIIVLLKNIEVSNEETNENDSIEERIKELEAIGLRSNLVHKQHEKKVNELNIFMKDHYESTNYFYDEMKRILKQRNIKDDLRRMVEYLERPSKSKLKAEVMKCYYRLKDGEAESAFNKNRDFWNKPTNDLVINFMHD